MAAFKDIEAKIQTKDLIHHETDAKRVALNKSRSQQATNFYQTQNRKVIKQIEADYKDTGRGQENAPKNKQKGNLPAYLRKFKQDAIKEKEQT